jgi:hypothetical protein
VIRFLNESEALAKHLWSVLAVAGRQENWEFGTALAQCPREVEAAYTSRHDDVRNYQFYRRIALEYRQGGRGVADRHCRGSDVPQQLDSNFGDFTVILDKQDAGGCCRQGSIVRDKTGRDRKFDGSRQKQRDRRALADFAMDQRGPTALLCKAVDLREPEPRSQTDLFGREKGFERAR